jgi:hypothetical protein
MNNTRQRIEKLEERISPPPSMVVLLVYDGETNEEAYARAFPDGSVKPKVVIYASELDALL